MAPAGNQRESLRANKEKGRKVKIQSDCMVDIHSFCQIDPKIDSNATKSKCGMKVQAATAATATAARATIAAKATTATVAAAAAAAARWTAVQQVALE